MAFSIEEAPCSRTGFFTELIKNKTIEEASKISNRAVAEALGGLPSIKMHCSVLAEEALTQAIKDYQSRNGLH